MPASAVMSFGHSWQLDLITLYRKMPKLIYGYKLGSDGIVMAVAIEGHDFSFIRKLPEFKGVAILSVYSRKRFPRFCEQHSRVPYIPWPNWLEQYQKTPPMGHLAHIFCLSIAIHIYIGT
jgi:hypothetical protein